MTTAYTARWLLDGTGTGPVSDAVVVVADDRIVAVGPRPSVALPGGTEFVDLGEATLMPGLVDAHVHLVWDAGPLPHRTVELEGSPERTVLRMAHHARQALVAGTTTVRDLGATGSLSLVLAEAIEAGHVPGPRVVAAGRAIAMTGGHAWHITSEADGADAVRRAVREELKRGAKVVKLMASGGVYDAGAGLGTAQLTLEEMAAAVDEAHRAGVRVAAHAYTPGPINAALDAGVDSIEHGSFLDEATARRMARERRWFVPTAMASHLIVRNAEALGTPSYMREKAGEVVTAVREAIGHALRLGTPLALGTDSGGAGIGHGTLVEEAVILAECGASAAEVVRMATSGGAELCGLADQTGMLAEGMAADLIAVGGDVSADVRRLADVRLVVSRGRRVPRHT